LKSFLISVSKDNGNPAYDVLLLMAVSSMCWTSWTSRSRVGHTQFIQSDCDVAIIPVDNLEHLAVDRTTLIDNIQSTCARTFC